METGAGEEKEEADRGHSQNSSTDECLSPIISLETLQSLEHLINPDEFLFQDFISNDNDQNHLEIASLRGAIIRAPLISPRNLIGYLDMTIVTFDAEGRVVKRNGGKLIELTKLNTLDPELAHYQPGSPQGSLTRTRSIAVKIEPPNDADDQIQIDRPGPSSSGSPFLNNSGVYGFDLYFRETENPTKSVAFTYSSKLDKLYVSVNKPCPFNFIFASRLPYGCLIRAVLYYKDPVFIHNAVERCLAHREKTHPINRGFDYPDHIIRCDSLEASYEQHPLTKRCSVIVPYQDADPSSEYNSINYSFTCFSSCYGINRRSTAMVFTLERGGQILGQKVVELRICACPGRDRFKDEKKLAINDISQNQANGEKISIKRPIQSEEVVTMSKKSDPPNKKRKIENGELITVSVQFQVRGKLQAEIYQGILNSIKESAKNNYA